MESEISMDSDTIARNYVDKTDQELLDLHATGTLTELAYEVLEEELTKRGVSIPKRPPPKEEQIAREKEQAWTKAKIEEQIARQFDKCRDQELLDLFALGKLKVREHNSLTAQMAARGVTIPASRGQRSGNFILDFAFIYVLAVLLVFSWPEFFTEDANGYAVSVVLYIIYYLPQEAVWGRTIGKHITGTKAVNQDGTELTFRSAVGRTLCRFIPFEVLSFVGRRPRGWHDSFSKTMVISLRKSPSDKREKSAEFDVKKAERHIRNAWIMGLACATGTLIFSFLRAYYENDPPKFHVDIWGLLDAVWILVLTYGSYKRNRFFTLGLLLVGPLIFFLGSVAMPGKAGYTLLIGTTILIGISIVTLIFGYFFFRGTISMFQLCKFSKEADQFSKKKSGAV